MFKKILIANRGEIATRVARACRELGAASVACYEMQDIGSMHIRVADECVLLQSPDGFTNPQAILRIAEEKEVDAIHPGYSFLAESAGFIRACEARGIAFIGPPAGIVDAVHDPDRLDCAAREVGIPTVTQTDQPPQPVHSIGVQVCADCYQNTVHFGERQRLIQPGVRKLIEESPAPCLEPGLRAVLHSKAVELAAFFQLQNAGTVEFLIGADGTAYFAGITPRLQAGCTIPEIISRVDLIREQICVACGVPLSVKQDQINLEGSALLAFISAEEPCTGRPHPGCIEAVHLPNGPDICVDSSIPVGGPLPLIYDALILKVTAWGQNRPACLQKALWALKECRLRGVDTNLAYLINLVESPDFAGGVYSSDTLIKICLSQSEKEIQMRDLAAIVSILYAHKELYSQPSIPEQFRTGWRLSRRPASSWAYGGLIHDQIDREY